MKIVEFNNERYLQQVCQECGRTHRRAKLDDGFFEKWVEATELIEVVDE